VLFVFENFAGYHFLLLLIEMSAWTQLPKEPNPEALRRLNLNEPHSCDEQ
jgi:hypothetical protein